MWEEFLQMSNFNFLIMPQATIKVQFIMAQVKEVIPVKGQVALKLVTFIHLSRRHLIITLWFPSTIKIINNSLSLLQETLEQQPKSLIALVVEVEPKLQTTDLSVGTQNCHKVKNI